MPYVDTYSIPSKKMLPFYANVLTYADRWSSPISIKAVHLQKIFPSIAPHPPFAETIDPRRTNYYIICQCHTKGGLLDIGVTLAEFY